ncbi:MAG TPA: cupin domain-containing protein [Planctomycetota bacterium]|nr:cupin domain-containing protein [Planctomycetota bacterium]
MCAESLTQAIDVSNEPRAVLRSDPQTTVLVLRLAPGTTLPERRHVRSDVLVQVVEGAAAVEGFVSRTLGVPDVLFIPRQASCVLRNPGEGTLVLLVVLTPGVTALESRPFGSVRCPLCAAEIAVEEGDQSGDRFICPDCTVWMRIVEADRGYAAALLPPE